VDVARAKTTLSIDESLMRQLRIRAARSGKSLSEVVEVALRVGLGLIKRRRAKALLSEDQTLQLASQVVHEVRSRRRRARES
jgi:plasmid stability protein